LDGAENSGARRRGADSAVGRHGGDGKSKVSNESKRSKGGRLWSMVGCGTLTLIRSPNRSRRHVEPVADSRLQRPSLRDFGMGNSIALDRTGR
jgi:hypothetical protein